MNYINLPYWDTDLLLVETLGNVSHSALTGLAYFAVKLSTGLPNTLPNRWLPGATVDSIADAVEYINVGTTASPSWETVQSA